jgi:hypothetical protein
VVGSTCNVSNFTVYALLLDNADLRISISMDDVIITSKVLNIGWFILQETCPPAYSFRGPNDESQNEQLDIGFVSFKIP